MSEKRGLGGSLGPRSTFPNQEGARLGRLCGGLVGHWGRARATQSTCPCSEPAHGPAQPGNPSTTSTLAARRAVRPPGSRADRRLTSSSRKLGPVLLASGTHSYGTALKLVSSRKPLVRSLRYSQWKRSTVRRRRAFVPLRLLRLSARTHRCRATVAGRGPRPTLRFFNSACPPSLSPLPARLCAPTRACDLCGNFVTSLLVACGVGLGRSSSTSPERELLIDEQLSQ